MKLFFDLQDPLGAHRYGIVTTGDGAFWAVHVKQGLGNVALHYPAAPAFEAAREHIYAIAPAWLAQAWRQQVDRAIEEAQHAQAASPGP